MKSLLDQMGLERAHALMTEATHKAIANAHGLAVTVSIDGELRRVQPGGHAAPMTAQDSRQKAADEHGDSSSWLAQRG